MKAIGWLYLGIIATAVVAMTTLYIHVRNNSNEIRRVVVAQNNEADRQDQQLRRAVYALCRSGGRSPRACVKIANGVILPPILPRRIIVKLTKLQREAAERGPKGKQGEAGIPGSEGLQGLQGLIGEIGRSGRPGRDGKPGAPGPQGQRGAQGVHGERGSPGPAGLRGPQGTRGAQGPQGPQGPRGAQGPPGVTSLTFEQICAASKGTAALRNIPSIGVALVCLK